jgi:TRAP-type C4-dicarboxylate transport system permease small subunit
VTRLVRTAWGAIEGLARAVLVLLVAAMVAVTLAQVLSRYVLAAPLTWSEEAARYLLVWISFLAAWLAWRERAHLGLDVLAVRLARRAPRAARLIPELAVAVFAVASIAVAPPLLELTAMQPSAVLELPMAWVYAAWPAAAALILGDLLVGWTVGHARATPAGPSGSA